MSSQIAVITDSTANLPQELLDRHRITVVPLTVVLGDEALEEGTEVSAPAVTEALQHRGVVTTSRPNQQDFDAVYRAAADSGAEEIVSLHLSAELSGTIDCARLAATAAPVPVCVVDTRMVTMALGYAVLAAAQVAEAGGSVDEVVSAAQKRAGATSAFFYVDTLDHLRRGGRIGSAQALLGSALAVKPLLHLSDGTIQPLEKVRTAARAIARLEEISVERAGAGPVDLAVHHLASADRAEALAERLKARIPEVDELRVSEVSAVIGAHVGPGLLGVVVAPK